MPDGAGGGPGGVVARLMSAYACPSDSSDEEGEEELSLTGDDDDAAPGPLAAQAAVALGRELSPEERQWRAGSRGAPPRVLSFASGAGAAGAPAWRGSVRVARSS